MNHDYDDDQGLIISGNSGVVHLGDGDVISNTVVISGDGLTIVAGDNENGVHRTFGGKNKRPKK